MFVFCCRVDIVTHSSVVSRAEEGVFGEKDCGRVRRRVGRERSESRVSSFDEFDFEIS